MYSRYRSWTHNLQTCTARHPGQKNDTPRNEALLVATTSVRRFEYMLNYTATVQKQHMVYAWTNEALPYRARNHKQYKPAKTSHLTAAYRWKTLQSGRCTQVHSPPPPIASTVGANTGVAARKHAVPNAPSQPTVSNHSTYRHYTSRRLCFVWEPEMSLLLPITSFYLAVQCGQMKGRAPALKGRGSAKLIR